MKMKDSLLISIRIVKWILVNELIFW